MFCYFMYPSIKGILDPNNCSWNLKVIVMNNSDNCLEIKQFINEALFVTRDVLITLF